MTILAAPHEHPWAEDAEGRCVICGLRVAADRVEAHMRGMAAYIEKYAHKEPDRSYIEHPAERAIQEAVDRVEEMGAHLDLTAIVTALGKQREAVVAWNEREDKHLYEPRSASRDHEGTDA